MVVAWSAVLRKNLWLSSGSEGKSSRIEDFMPTMGKEGDGSTIRTACLPTQSLLPFHKINYLEKLVGDRIPS